MPNLEVSVLEMLVKISLTLWMLIIYFKTPFGEVIETNILA